MNYDLELIDTYTKILVDFKENQKNVVAACISGGAVRDMLLEKPIKDIDIFYHGTIDDHALSLIFKKPSLIKTIKNKFYPKEEDDDELAIEVYKDSGFKVPYQELYYKDVQLPIQLIEVKDTSNILKWIDDDFGCNISKVSIIPNGSLVLTQEFILDATLKILTFKTDCQNSYRNKIIAKYPEYSCNGLGGDDLLQW